MSEVSGSGSVTGTHAYAAPGLYTVKVTVTDKDGGAGQSLYRYVIVYDPSAGFVTGGGWIDSPAGSLGADRSLSGRANFGFTARYQKDASVPTGQVEFQFQNGNLNLHSTGLEWLVASGSKAYLKGSGTLNGGNYGFLLVVVNGPASGGGSDTVRMRIWDTATGAALYDSQTGTPDDANPTAIAQGGNITIHGG